MNTPESLPRVSGWFFRDRGTFYLLSDRGWIELVDIGQADLAAAGITTEQPVVAYGRWAGKERFGVTRIVANGRASGRRSSPGDRPYFAVHPVPQIHTASRLRGWIHRTLHEDDYLEVQLPTIWGRSEEYGVEEFQLAHSLLKPNGDLRLLQSPEFPLWTALASGVGSCYSFCRCYRHEAQRPAGREGDYLAEFEQLVIAQPGTSLEEMIPTAERLVIDIARQVGIDLAQRDFVRVGPADLVGQEVPGIGSIDDLTLFTVPAHWTVKARQLAFTRLTEAGASIWAIGDATGPGEGYLLGRPGQPIRWAIQPGDDPEKVARLLDVATGFTAETQSVATASSLQWNPTWNMYPGLRWKDDENHDSGYLVRSITSKRVTSPTGSEHIADAELYLGGREVIHVRSYADGPDFFAGLSDAGVPGLEERYGYLKPLLETAPAGMVGIFVGWERLLSLMLGTESAADLQLFPRGGDGAPLHSVTHR